MNEPIREWWDCHPLPVKVSVLKRKQHVGILKHLMLQDLGMLREREVCKLRGCKGAKGIVPSIRTL